MGVNNWQGHFANRQAVSGLSRSGQAQHRELVKEAQAGHGAVSYGK
jgi:hypothetical protein